MKTWHYALIVFLGGCCLGILSTFVKLAYAAGYSMGEVTGSQVLVGTIIIWIVTFFIRKKKFHFNQTLKLVSAGIPMGLTGLLYYQSLQTLEASLAIICLFQFIWIGTLIEWIYYRRKPSLNKVISIVILLSGSVLAAGLFGGSLDSISWQGALWGMLSAFTFSIFIFLSGIIGNDIPAVQKSALLSTGALLVTFICFPPVFLADFTTVIGVAPYGLILGIFGVVLPPLLFSIGMPHVGPGLGTILTASELPVAIILSAVVLSEYISMSQWTGVGLILCGIIVGNIGSMQAGAIMETHGKKETDEIVY
ncbi:DMT family transporter [Sutcliffiella horikoshii]|uniref:EamA family transporter n=1 Tax=Sutcliffiella horikoshii TaxID=79883 RepID=UPI00203AAF2C|nr:DMT family transporter [Sutcliffiella horikoshii]MCM3619890.1 DMT family transporter [Sutcliffiella horikoshii]